MIVLIALETSSINGRKTIALFAAFEELKIWIKRRSWILGEIEWFNHKNMVTLGNGVEKVKYYWRVIPYYPPGHFDMLDMDEIRC